MRRLLLAALLAPSLAFGQRLPYYGPGPAAAVGTALINGGTIGATTPVSTGTFLNSYSGTAYSGMVSGGAARTWVGLSDSGYMTYFELGASAAFSRTGTIGLSGASRTSDGGVGTAAIGIAGMGRTNSANGSSWGAYFHAVREASGTGTALGIEVNSANVNTFVGVSPYLMGTAGTTASIWASVGGETAQSGTTVNPSSCAVCIVSTTSGANGAVYDKGIVFQSVAMAVANSVTGSKIAMQMPTGGELNWNYDGSGIRSGFIRGSGAAAGLGLVFGSNTLNIANNAETTNLVTFDGMGNQALAGTQTVAGTVTTAGIFLNASQIVRHTVPPAETTFVMAGTTTLLRLDAVVAVPNYTITLPNDYVQGHIVTLTTRQTITALTVLAPTGAVVIGAPTSLTPTTPATFIFIAADGAFQRIS